MVAFKDSKGLWEEEETLKLTKNNYCSLAKVFGSFHCCLFGPLLWGRGYGEEQAIEFRKDSCSLVRGKDMV